MSQVLTGSLSRRRPTPRGGLEVGVLRLPCGFQVRYQLDPVRQWVEVLDVSATGNFHPALASP